MPASSYQSTAQDDVEPRQQQLELGLRELAGASHRISPCEITMETAVFIPKV